MWIVGGFILVFVSLAILGAAYWTVTASLRPVSRSTGHMLELVAATNESVTFPRTAMRREMAS